jgi:hypothetical protein
MAFDACAMMPSMARGNGIDRHHLSLCLAVLWPSFSMHQQKVFVVPANSICSFYCFGIFLLSPIPRYCCLLSL